MENFYRAGGAAGATGDGSADPAEQTCSGPDAAIRSANQALAERSGDGLSLAIAVLIEQRDQALRLAEASGSEARREREALLAEQDQFITFLMTDHERKLASLEDELSALRERLGRQEALEPKELAPPSGGQSSARDASFAEAEQQIADLRQLLEAAYAEIDETRGDAARLQSELDETIRSFDDVRLALHGEVEAARDEAFAIQGRLDATSRVLEDARDQARNEAFRSIEELDELRRELDERNAEVLRLRQRLAELTQEARHSRPPPPAPAEELERARSEMQSLRKQLIETKRELSRVARELELAQTRRVTRPGLPLTRAPDSSSAGAHGSHAPPPSERHLTPAGLGPRRPSEPKLS